MLRTKDGALKEKSIKKKRGRFRAKKPRILLPELKIRPLKKNCSLGVGLKT
jgi:hypothetical protein